GVPGELYLGGDGLARGYLARPDLTAERFLPDPFCRVPGARFYSTGDLARWRSDGSLEFLGRLDHQVKLRGYRIELAEIEEALAQLPAIQEAVVVLHEDTPENKRLVAYIVAKDGLQPLPPELHRELRTKLPEYMCPSTYMILAALPRTTTGKVNREALPSSTWERPEQEDSYVAPGNPIEEELARLWAEVLEIERVGVTDNFFAAGG